MILTTAAYLLSTAHHADQVRFPPSLLQGGHGAHAERQERRLVGGQGRVVGAVRLDVEAQSVALRLGAREAVRQGPALLHRCGHLLQGQTPASRIRHHLKGLGHCETYTCSECGRFNDASRRAGSHLDRRPLELIQHRLAFGLPLRRGRHVLVSTSPD